MDSVQQHRVSLEVAKQWELVQKTLKCRYDLSLMQLPFRSGRDTREHVNTSCKVQQVLLWSH